MTVICHSCQHDFPDYESLAKHISGSKKGHRQGKRWAAGYLMKIRRLNSKRDFKPANPMSEADRENRAKSFRELSGKNRMTFTMCPTCKKGFNQILPVEFADSKDAWRNKLGVPMVNCPEHR